MKAKAKQKEATASAEKGDKEQAERLAKEAHASERDLAEVREQMAGMERKLHTIHTRHGGKAKFRLSSVPRPKN